MCMSPVWVLPQRVSCSAVWLRDIAELRLPVNPIAKIMLRNIRKLYIPVNAIVANLLLLVRAVDWCSLSLMAEGLIAPCQFTGSTADTISQIDHDVLFFNSIVPRSVHCVARRTLPLLLPLQVLDELLGQRQPVVGILDLIGERIRSQRLLE